MLRERGRLLGSAAASLAIVAVVTSILLPGQGRVAARTSNASHGPKTAVICLDVTPSVSPKIIPQSLQLIAREVKAQAHPGSSGFTAYVRTIRDNSVDPSNNLLIIDVPAVHKARRESGSNLDPSTIQTSTATYNRAEHARQVHDLAHAKAVANVEANKVLHLRVTPDTKYGTDLLACPEAAAQLMDASGTNYLLVISDLLPYGHQGDYLKGLQLPHVSVFVVDYCHQDFRICIPAENTFARILKEHGAKSISIRNSAALPRINGIFDP